MKFKIKKFQNIHKYNDNNIKNKKYKKHQIYKNEIKKLNSPYSVTKKTKQITKIRYNMIVENNLQYTNTNGYES